MLERLVKNPRHTRSGFPDLTLWNPQTGALKVPTHSLTCVMPLWKRGTHCFAPVVWFVNQVLFAQYFLEPLIVTKLDTMVFLESRSSLLTNVFLAHMVIGQC